MTIEYLSGIIYGMKVKTSVTLSKEILDLIEKNIKKSQNRSTFIENAVIYYIKNYRKSVRDSKDIDIINRHYDELNEEAEDVLEYQDL